MSPEHRQRHRMNDDSTPSGKERPRTGWKEFLRPLERACSGWWLAVVFAAVFHLLFFAYSPGLEGPFIYDDHEAVVANPDLRGGFDITRFFRDHDTSLHYDRRPVTGILTWADFQWAGLDPHGFKLTNLFLHLLTACAAFHLLKRLAPRFGCPFPALFATACVAIWMVHPLLTSAVSFVFQRSEILMSLFFLLSLICLDRAAGRSGVGSGCSWSVPFSPRFRKRWG